MQPRGATEAAVYHSMTALVAVLEHVKNSKDFRQALEDTLTDFSILLGADRGLLILQNLDGEAVVAHEYRLDEEQGSLVGLPVTDDVLLKRLAESAAPFQVFSRETGLSQGLVDLSAGGIASSLFCSLTLRGEWLGALVIQTAHQAREWHAEDAAQVRLYCTCIATLMYAMLLWDDLSRLSLNHVQQLNQVLSTSARFGLVPSGVVERLQEATRPAKESIQRQRLAGAFPGLSDRQVDVLVHAELRPREIGDLLGISEATVKRHLTDIRKVLGVDSPGAVRDLVRRILEIGS